MQKVDVIPGGFVDLQRPVKPTLRPQLSHPWSTAASITTCVHMLILNPKVMLDGPLSLSIAQPCLVSSMCL